MCSLKILGIPVVVLACCLFNMGFIDLDRYANTSEDDAIQTTRPEQSLSQSAQPLASGWEHITTFEAYAQLDLQLLTELCDALEEGMWVTAIRQRGDEMMIEGKSISSPFLSDFIRNLSASNAFQEVDVPYHHVEYYPSLSQSILEFQITALRVATQTERQASLQDIASCPDFFTPLILDEEQQKKTNGQTSPYAHPLRTVEIPQLKLTEILLSPIGNYARIRTLQGKLYAVAVGTPVGKQEGKVVSITQNGLMIQEQENGQEITTQLPCIECTIVEIPD